jgi:hypothetical protein
MGFASDLYYRESVSWVGNLRLADANNLGSIGAA